MSMIRGITTCQVLVAPDKVCGKTFTGPGFAVVEGRTQVHQKRHNSEHDPVIQYMNQLQEHIHKAHPEEADAIGMRGLEFIAMLHLLNFKTTDGAMKDQIQFLRWQINQQTIPIRLRDEKLDGMASQYANEVADLFKAAIHRALGPIAAAAIPEQLRKEVTAAIQKKTATTIRELRDLYEEPDRYNISVVEVPKDATSTEPPVEIPSEPPKRPLLVLPE